MEFKIAGKKEVREPIVTLGLVEDNRFDGITVVAVNANGEIITGGELCTFRKSGRILMRAQINPDLGFCLNDAGQIEIV